MMEESFEDMVNRLAKPGEKILTEMSPEQMHLLHMAVGASGETGELLDAVKKYCIYQKFLDVENVKEEIGDTLFYLQGICNNLEFTFEDCIRQNQRKLNKRYNAGSYSNEQAQQRADKG